MVSSCKFDVRSSKIELFLKLFKFDIIFESSEDLFIGFLSFFFLKFVMLPNLLYSSHLCGVLSSYCILHAAEILRGHLPIMSE